MFIDGRPREWGELPRPDLPLTVGLDGGYVHACDQRLRRDGWFEVIAGKSMPTEGAAKCFGFVETLDIRPKRRLFEVLRSQGMQMNQQVTFVTDGGRTCGSCLCKGFLWHGNLFRALQVVDDLEVDLDTEEAAPDQRRLLKAVGEFSVYLRANGAWMPNYG